MSVAVPRRRDTVAGVTDHRVALKSVRKEMAAFDEIADDNKRRHLP
jgi:hypothetical protein